MLLLIHTKYTVFELIVKEFTIHFATINTTKKSLYRNRRLHYLQYTLLLLILFVNEPNLYKVINLQYTLLLLIHDNFKRNNDIYQDLQYTLLLLIQFPDTLLSVNITSFTIHFATINTLVAQDKEKGIRHLQYTLLLLIRFGLTPKAAAICIYNTLCYY